MAAPTLDLGNLLIHLKADTRQYKMAMSTATKGLDMFARQAKRALLAAAAYAAVATKAFASFQEQMANVATMLDDHTMNLLPAYGDAIQQMSMEFGEGTKTLSDGLYDILSASVPASKALDVLAVSAKAAKAGMTTTKVAADAITTVLNSYQMSADEAGRVSDILFATVKRGKTTFAELAPNIGKVASIASTAGLSIEEVAAAISTMTRAGLQADIATTSLRSIMNSFLKPTEDAQSAARALGLELSSTTLRTMGLTGVLKQLSGATAEQLAEIMPNVRGLAGWAAQMKQAEGQARDLELMLNSAGLTQEAYDKMTNTLIHSFRQFWQTMKVTSVMLGTTLAPMVEKATDTMKEWIQTHQPQIGIVFIKTVRGMIEAVNWLGGAIRKLPMFWKQFSIEAFKAQRSLYRMADAATNLDEIFAFIRKDTSTYKAEVGRLTREIMVLEKETKNMAESFVESDAGAQTFFDTFLDGLDEAQKKLEEDVAVQKMRESWKHVYDELDKAKDAMQEIKDMNFDDKIEEMNEVVSKFEIHIRAGKEVMKDWIREAQDIGTRLAEGFTRALDGISESITQMVMTGKADFKGLLKSVLADILQMMIRWRMAQAIMGIAGVFKDGDVPTPFVGPPAPVGLGGVHGPPAPPLHSGGSVSKTGLAVVHKGEVFSGTNNEMGFGQPPTVVINNNTGTKIKQQGAPRMEANQWVINTVIDDITHGGDLAVLLGGQQ